MKGFKGFNKDMTCRGFQYEVGKSYTFDGRIELCQKGFHFCESLSDCFGYYERDDSRFCEIEASGDIRKGADKNCCSEIKIIRELSQIEINRTVYGDGDGYGYGYGNGDGYGYGNGYGYGDGNGYGNGDGDGYGYGYGYGNGYGDGYGYGNGDGYGYGNGDGNGDGYGYGNGDGYGYGNGDGYGYGYGYGNGKNIQKILNFTEVA